MSNQSDTSTDSGLTGQSKQEQIAALAYSLWEARGCPEGSSEEDWFEAEQQLNTSLKQLAAGA